MSETIKKSWIKDEAGNKVAPRTITSAIQDEDGNAFQNYIDNMVMISNEVSDEVPEVINNTSEDIVTFESGDSEGTDYVEVPTMASGETHKSLFAKISTMFKNVRYLFKMLGTTDISAIGDGTTTGAISTLNSNLANTLTLLLCARPSQLTVSGNSSSTNITQQVTLTLAKQTRVIFYISAYITYNTTNYQGSIALNDTCNGITNDYPLQGIGHAALSSTKGIFSGWRTITLSAGTHTLAISAYTVNSAKTVSSTSTDAADILILGIN